MPVSKKRKKEGKPVQRHAAIAPAHEGAEHPEGPLEHGAMKAGKPKNPFVKNTSQVRGAQRGR
ncbi:MAG TPA: hypothetical protein VF400_07310 [Anaeromyxobacteraceae bacterium]